MAEALLRHYAGERFEVLSAGIAPTEVHPVTRQVLTDIGLAPSGLYVKNFDDFRAKVSITYATIVCDQAGDGCTHRYPFALQALHWTFDDPTQAEGSTAEHLHVFRTIRDRRERRLRTWLETLADV